MEDKATEVLFSGVERTEKEGTASIVGLNTRSAWPLYSESGLGYRRVVIVLTLTVGHFPYSRI